MRTTVLFSVLIFYCIVLTILYGGFAKEIFDTAYYGPETSEFPTFITIFNHLRENNGVISAITGLIAFILGLGGGLLLDAKAKWPSIASVVMAVVVAALATFDGLTLFGPAGANVVAHTGVVDKPEQVTQVALAALGVGYAMTTALLIGVGIKNIPGVKDWVDRFTDKDPSK